MRIPVTPPTLVEVLTGYDGRGLPDLLLRNIGPAPEGKYRHWDTLRRVTPPEGLRPEEWWAAIKFARSQGRRRIPLLDKAGRAFSYCTPDPVLELLHEIDRNASGPIAANESITNPQTRDRYVQSSLIEEAITSSQLEGAATTRDVAKEMIRTGRTPVDRSERMILNNYRAIKLVSQFKERSLTPELLYELHEIITDGTLEEDKEQHHLRTPGDGIAVYDDRDNTLLHQPPDASELPGRIQAICDFANQDESDVFLHPVIKAITLHFWLAYDHPFVDGNGRTARALFYWSMLRQGFWLFEFVSISRIIRGAPAKYSRSFLYTETDENDLTYFILNQLGIIKRSIDELHNYLQVKAQEVQQTERLLRSSVTLNHRQLALLGHALRHPGMRYSFESHRMSQGIAYQTARTDLLDLVEKGVLIQAKYGKTFVFRAPDDIDSRLRRLA